jgi:hypothetical protein
MSKDVRYAASQSITTIGIVEQVSNVSSADDLIKHTAKRSVFSAEDLRHMHPTEQSPVKVIDFLLIGHTQRSVRLDTLLTLKVFANHPPQSITQLTEDRYVKLKSLVQLGFDF